MDEEAVKIPFTPDNEFCICFDNLMRATIKNVHDITCTTVFADLNNAEQFTVVIAGILTGLMTAAAPFVPNTKKGRDMLERDIRESVSSARYSMEEQLRARGMLRS
jgi:hypothetical protein